MKTFRSNAIAFLFSFALFFLLLQSVYGQFGEVAGQPTINVPLGGANATNVTLANSGPTPIRFTSVLPSFTNYGKTTPPVITLIPENGTIPPYSDLNIEIRAYLPAHNNSVGDSWTGIVQFVEVSNTTNAGGAVINAGLAKILTVKAAHPKLDLLLYAAAVIVLVLIALVSYLALRKRKRAKKAASAKAAKSESKRRKAKAGK